MRGARLGLACGRIHAGDHPRGCGEHFSAFPQVGYMDGSSPRMRGAHRRPDPADHGTGIIPADAGSTDEVISPIRYSRDHPRGCGEHSILGVLLPCTPGSSPRMRGAHQWAPWVLKTARIIPADAGSTIRPMVVAPYTEDHPRGCGEHDCPKRSYGRFRGSSPRMRGALLNATQRGTLHGIIPADAGSTGYPARRGVADRDHPRGCGEHTV